MLFATLGAMSANMHERGGCRSDPTVWPRLGASGPLTERVPDGRGRARNTLTTLGTCLYLSHLTSQHSPLLTDPSKNKWVYGGNVLVDPVSDLSQI